jgi:hypothetical protein
VIVDVMHDAAELYELNSAKAKLYKRNGSGGSLAGGAGAQSIPEREPIEIDEKVCSVFANLAAHAPTVLQELMLDRDKDDEFGHASSAAVGESKSKSKMAIAFERKGGFGQITSGSWRGRRVCYVFTCTFGHFACVSGGGENPLTRRPLRRQILQGGSKATVVDRPPEHCATLRCHYQEFQACHFLVRRVFAWGLNPRRKEGQSFRLWTCVDTGPPRYLDSGSLLVVSAAFIVATSFQVASAFVHCHTKEPPIVHRDLKPDNVLYDRDSHRVKVQAARTGRRTHPRAHL